jgi:hypothetical protein
VYDLTPAEILNRVKQAIREPYVGPGKYPLYVVMTDGTALSCRAARDNWRDMVWSTLRRSRDGWAAAGVAINWRDASLICDQTGDLIPAAYGADRRRG